MTNFLYKESTAVPSTGEPIRYAQLYVIDHNFQTISYKKKKNNNNEKSKNPKSSNPPPFSLTRYRSVIERY